MTKPYTLTRGDVLAVLRTLPDNSFDSIVCDPPYELGFMGKGWDKSGIANNPEMWAEAMRVLKPGGHLLAFSGSRTYHRMACAIEDGGFEIRDQIQWIYGSGFPKSNNLDKLRGTQTCGCMVSSVHDTTPATGSNESASARTAGKKPTPEHDLRLLRESHLSASQLAYEKCDQDVRTCLPEQATRECPLTHSCSGCEACSEDDGSEKSSLEGRRDDVQAQGQLQGHPLHSGAGSTATDGAGGRIHHGASSCYGDVVRVSADEDGSGAPCRSRSSEQPSQQPGNVADEQRAQAPRAWPDCPGCGLPVVPKGFGTALKPAHEPICVARKPLIGTVAANVLAHGTGALNIDGCRVPLNGDYKCKANGRPSQTGLGDNYDPAAANQPDTVGRWPANLIHDGSDEVVALFPQSTSGAMKSGTQRAAQEGPGSVCYGPYGGAITSADIPASAGSAARFFYSAKASRQDRNEGLPSSAEPAVTTDATMRECEDADWSKRNGNHHPTVKPTDLMAYLVRMVTPPGGVVLDPFMGSGSTGKACMREGMQFIGIELEAGYLEIATARIEFELARVTEANKPAPATPQMSLFESAI